ncbi:ABC transporter permease [Paenibacillus crassostreae]|uniref:Putative hemin transport system permease protein HrtB n=1 Tax=Paenibacillus crassostreae TaxID=1763538 RepID=A0A167FF99_9BACL|nr:ABC transporter permease [Paenibacillus crassostreae]AOZ94464.1 ABC transporter permease [Paenibacillus crassostreae]OAB76498.1 ABC transporter permease [Paenibacillus crassostreae]
MFLALRELRHSKARYTLIVVIMLLVSFLVLFVTGLAKGLAYANVSAVENMPANYFIVQGDADHKFRRSQLNESDLQDVRSIVGNDNATPLSIQMSTITATDLDVKADITFFAVDMSGMIAPSVVQGDMITNDMQGNVIVDRKLEESGIEIGSIIRDQQTGMDWNVVGFVEDNSYSHTPVVYMNDQDWQEMNLGRGQKDNSALINTIAVQATEIQVSSLQDKLDGLDIITQKEAISSIPGYAEEQSSLLMMIVFLFVIAAVVLAVFFYVITIQKTSQFGILKAIGTKTSYLAWSVIGQVFILSVISIAISLMLTGGMSTILPESLPFRLNISTMILTSVLFVGMSLIGSLISVLRVAKVDALEAIGRVGA